jgi:peptidyl-prolyl cis-trans isomerase B (cyclophilin B)
MADPVVDVTTNLGTFTIQLDPARAPKSVENILAYVDAEHFDGTIFHRVIPTFMVQGGGYDQAYERKPTRAPVQNEADNGLKNTRGTVAMARTGDPHSATAQFFVNVVDNAFLDHKAKDGAVWGYAVFGRVIEGMDVVDKI